MRNIWVKRLTLFLAMMMLVLTSLPLVAFAGTTSTCVISGNDISCVNKAFEKLSDEYDNSKGSVYCVGGKLYCMDNEGNTKAEIIEWKSSEGKLTFYGDAFEAADTKSKAKALDKFSDAITNSKVSTTGRQNIAGKLLEGSSESNEYLLGLALNSTSADLFTALKWLSPILEFMRILIGVGAIVIIMLLVASTVMDCVYIGLPMWREQQANKDGGGGKPFGVSMEALSTVKEIESNIEGGQYKNAYLLYFRRRALTYIILAICILYLIVGELGGLIQGLLNMVSGFTS